MDRTLVSSGSDAVSAAPATDRGWVSPPSSAEAFADQTHEELNLDARRRLLAQRLFAHRARTHTICRYTGLTRHALATLRSRWRVAEQSRHRGPSPHSPQHILRSPRLRAEATAVLSLCSQCGLLDVLRSARAATRLQQGEQLCVLYELYRSCVQESSLEFEHVLLILRALLHSRLLQLSTCIRCGGHVLVDRLSAASHVCGTCRVRAD